MRETGAKKKLLVVTAVWGDWHIQKYFNVNLPTLIAEGNFPALRRYCDITYLIYTSGADMARVREAPAIRALGALMNVEFRLITDDALTVPMVTHHAIWNEAANQAKESNSFILLMPPDVAWSNGSFEHVGRLLEAGKQAVFMTYLRVEAESFARELQRRPRNSSGALAIDSRELVHLCLGTLHPLMAAYLRNSTHFPLHPEMILWPVYGEGLLCRVLAREMFIYNPALMALNHNNLAETILDESLITVVDDSDALFGVSLAPFDKEFEWYYWPRVAGPVDVGEWWLEYDSWVNDIVANTDIRWHTGAATHPAWKQGKRGADLFLRKAAAQREGLRLMRAARTMGCDGAADLLALAVQRGMLPRIARGRGGSIVFVPVNEALETTSSSRGDLSISTEKELSGFLRSHFVPTKTLHHAVPLEERLKASNELRLNAADGSQVVVTRKANRLHVNGLPLGSPQKVGRHAVYAVEGVLSNKA